MKLGAVIIDTRCNDGLVDIIKNHMKYLPNFELNIFCNEMASVFSKEFPQARVFRIGFDLTINSYNKFLTNNSLWYALPYDKVVIFQADSMILREGIEDFLHFDYIGASWSFPPYVGNGGFSVRNPTLMIECINRVKYNSSIHGNEDVYFANNMSGKIANINEADKFSCETKFVLGTLGYHAIEKYLSETDCLTIKNQYK